MEEITVYYATPWQLLAAAAPYAIKGVGQLLGVGKPKKEDYMPDTSYMDKYIANIRSRQAGRDVYHQAMQPALRTIGSQGRKMQRQVGYGVEKAGLTGSGIEAQQRLSAGKATLGAMQEASEKATAAQISESRRLGTEADRMTMQKEGAIAQGEKAFDRAETAFGQEKLANVIGGVGAVAGAGIQMGAAADEAKLFTSIMDKEVKDKLTTAGIPTTQLATLSKDIYDMRLKSISAIYADPNATAKQRQSVMDALINDIESGALSQ